LVWSWPLIYRCDATLNQASHFSCNYLCLIASALACRDPLLPPQLFPIAITSSLDMTSASSSLLPSLVLFLVLLFARSSPALSASVVARLPGYPGPLPFYMETGYVTVDEVNGAELFYYFTASEGDPSQDPLLLWLTGGDRCSVFSGLAFELGPVKFVISEYNGSIPTLTYNPYSWTKVSSIIFVDSPVGAGFSFSRDDEGYDIDDTAASMQVHKFLVKWFIDHPQYLPNPLYIAGDSYAGIYVPLVAQAISQDNEAGLQPHLNLKGYILGNPATGEKIDRNSRIPYAHGMGIISDEMFESTERNCDGQDYRYPTTTLCSKSLDAVKKFFSEIMKPYILDPKCAFVSPKPEATVADRRTMEESDIKLLKPPPLPPLYCRTYAYVLSYYWANNKVTREALHIKKGTKEEWRRCNEDLPFRKEVKSTIKYHANLTRRGYRALVYSGDHDLVVPFLGTMAWIKSLNYSIVDDWRSWHVDSQVAGYTMTYVNNLTFATVKNGGHTAPEYRPKECLAMIRSTPLSFIFLSCSSLQNLVWAFLQTHSVQAIREG
ncbi:unnamed protein product, partial [Musa hybrid cultivar]